MTSNLRIRLRQAVYLIALFLIIVFLTVQGREPWIAALGYWKVVMGLVLLTPLSLCVQTISFRFCLPKDSLELSLATLVRIWAIASITSLVAPLVAGLAIRVTLLKQEGLDIKLSSIATIRQAFINLEYAWIAASIILMLYPWPKMIFLGYATITLWLIYKLLYLYTPLGNFRVFKLFLTSRKYSKLPQKAYPWLWGQIVAMALNYWLSFTLGGARLSFHLCLLLACLTVIMSIVVFVPNGLGVLDALWVWIASQQGLSLAEGTALALTIRLGFMIGAIITYLAICLIGWKNERDLKSSS